MQNFFLAVGLILIANAFVCLFRAIVGPTLPDRIVAINIVGTKTLVILVLIAHIFGQHMYIDTAFVYALLNFIVTVAVARYLETGGLPSA
ncbi:monovalent cation/H+ antiporter complex subunit F [Candidatus Oleimmundimicrobium sp.]|uniref:monovalent cation/H+ antiporter complex subunit F n=1 Tax=Candidatus Oleimmundimicrobium sp. TaxID=3060597 RepID=UPI0027191CFA|nr:monovalent cation/H+ antiporter complex subunit F [Candidatus Oleimmundimicrobium sp.]MDO8885881.1 monovalent cation/H+ antiporter complex subunit F [Candidatus Oleimmundimicrobium sp.]